MKTPRHTSSGLDPSASLEQLTRLCQVDPRTGELLLPPPQPAEATRLLSVPTPPPLRRTGDFVPKSGARSTTELTIPWQAAPPTSPSKEALRRLGNSLRAVPRRTKVLGLAAVVGLALCGVLPRTARLEPMPQRPEPEPTPRSESGDSDAKPVQLPVPLPQPTAAALPLPELAPAIVAVAEGRYAEARDLYEELHRAHPEDDVISAALSILRTVDADLAETRP